jgi:hypothetical protein
MQLESNLRKLYVIILLTTIIFIEIAKLFNSCSQSSVHSPGIWAISPSVLISGTEIPVKVLYNHTGADLPANTIYKFKLELISVESTFHCHISETVRLIPFKGELPKIIMKQRIVGIGFIEITLVFPEGLKKGDSFAITTGNIKPNGDIIALINPFPIDDLPFAVYSKLPGCKLVDWADAGWWENVPHCKIIAGPASSLRVVTPTLVKADEPFNLKISITDDFDARPDKSWTGCIKITPNNNIYALPLKVNLKVTDNSSKEVKGLKISKEGIYRIVAWLGERRFESNPIVVKTTANKKIYWGIIHNHGQYSEGFGNSNEYFYDFARHVSCLDYVALSDHYYQLPTVTDTMGTMEETELYDTTRNHIMDYYKGRLLKWKGRRVTLYDSWKNSIAAADNANDSGRFVTLIGYEWSSQEAGHYNIYIEKPTVKNMNEIFLSTYNGYSKPLFNLLVNSHALMIPHISAGYFLWLGLEEKLNNIDKKQLIPVVEVYSDWGNSFSDFKGVNDPMNLTGGMRNAGPRSVSWALENGFKLSLISDGDSHSGLPGRRVVGGIAPVHDHVAGITAARTNTFSRKGIMDAYHNKDTYGTTGERIYIETSANGIEMGHSMETDSCFIFNVNIAGTDDIAIVKLFKGNKLIYKSIPKSGKDVSLRIPCDPPANKQEAFTVEATQKNEQMVWSSPIWISRKAPELSWKKDTSGLYIINTGTTEAKNVIVAYSKDEHPFTVEDKGIIFPAPSAKVANIWSITRDNQNEVLFFRWQGDPLKATMSLKGAEISFEEQNFNQDINILEKVADNKYKFSILQKNTSKQKSLGFQVMLKVKGDAPAYVTFTFDREIHVNHSGINSRVKSITIPINGRLTSSPLYEIIVPSIKSGEKFKIESKQGFFSIDPMNHIFETNEGDNLIQLIN